MTEREQVLGDQAEQELEQAERERDKAQAEVERLRLDLTEACRGGAVLARERNAAEAALAAERECRDKSERERLEAQVALAAEREKADDQFARQQRVIGEVCCQRDAERERSERLREAARGRERTISLGVRQLAAAEARLADLMQLYRLLDPMDMTPEDAEVYNRVAALAPAQPEEPRDKCEFCLGAKGGVPGNENVLDGGAVICDYCSALLAPAQPACACFGEEACERCGASTQPERRGYAPTDALGDARAARAEEEQP